MASIVAWLAIKNGKKMNPQTRALRLNPNSTNWREEVDG
jgi:hypothetical protein